MKSILVNLLCGGLLCVGCVKHAANPINQVPSSEHLPTSFCENQTSNQLSNAMAESEREYQNMVLHPEMLANRPASEWTFPNYQAGPLNPRPVHVNFYAVNDKYPKYLLCQYDINEKAYNKKDETKWLGNALMQIRQHGQKSFPPVGWVAVVVNNRAEHKNASTFEQSFKVGAIFKASDIFDSARNLSQLIVGVEMDRHPFKYDTAQPSPGEQQRWMIVERHATNNPNIGAKQ